MQQSRLSLLLFAVLAALTGCRPVEPVSGFSTGSVQLAVSTGQALSSGEVSRVTVVSSAADFAPITIELVQTEGIWGGVIGNVPAGPRRTFLAQAFDSTDTLRYEGQVEDVTIVDGELTLVTLTLQEVSGTTPYANEAPLIDWVVASPLVVEPGSTVALLASAHDRNPEDSLTFAWAATSGSIMAPAEASTSWSAPSVAGPVTLTLTVSDSQGAASSVSLTVRVSGGGGAVLDVHFNSRPMVLGLTSSQSLLDIGQQTGLHVFASDSDGDPLSYDWSASCEGRFVGANTPTASFTPTALPAGACNNCQLRVAISDERGGQTVGTLSLCVAAAPASHLPPRLVRSYQSSLTATPSQLITFEVVASDPEGSPLTFTWSASEGTLGTASGSATRSRMTWRAPSCMPANTLPSITATITNGLGLTASRVFVVEDLPSCSPHGIWAPAMALGSPRWQHTATLLLSGKVLVAGGYDTASGTFPDWSEIYDPATNTWAPTGVMSAPRYGHTATRLLSGKVLVSGGVGNSPDDVYDPATDTWAPTGSMMTRRYGHSAVLLPTGKVLVVGGRGSSTESPFLATAEVYDPVSGTWAPTGSMSVPRAAELTLLPSGKVLATGGGHATESLALAEIYDPATGTWSLTGSMMSPRELHTATLLPSGKVLVTGGCNWFAGTCLETAEEFDPATGTWAPTGAMSSIHAAHSATLLPSGKVLVSSGHDGVSPTLALAEVYDPSTGTWDSTGAMIMPRYGHSATLLPSGQVFVLGGIDLQGFLSSAELYLP